MRYAWKGKSEWLAVEVGRSIGTVLMDVVDFQGLYGLAGWYSSARTVYWFHLCEAEILACEELAW